MQEETQSMLVCPFCGGEPYIFPPERERQYHDFCWGSCEECGSEGAAKKSVEEAVAAWNQRV